MWKEMPWHVRQTRFLGATRDSCLQQQLHITNHSPSHTLFIISIHARATSISNRSTYLTPSCACCSYPDFCSDLSSRAPPRASVKTEFSVYLSEPDACQTVVSCEMCALFFFRFDISKSGLLFTKARVGGQLFSATQHPEKGAIKYFHPFSFATH
jgi:hypothetical protein